MNELALFAGGNGGILGGKLLGWRTQCAVELDPYCQRILLQRQADGCLDPFPIWDNVCTFDGNPWRGSIDIVTGGFPCQDISAAGRGAGIDGERSGLWREMARIIREVGPRFVLVENSPVLTSRGLGTVLGDLAAMGYDARWGVLGAVHARAPHKRERIWIVANATSTGARPDDRRLWSGSCRVNRGQKSSSKAVADATRIQPGRQEQRAERERVGACGESVFANGGDSDGARLEKREGITGDDGEEFAATIGTDWWIIEPSIRELAHGLAHQLDIHGTAAIGYMGRVASGVPDRVARLKALGNGQVPACVAFAWRILAADFITEEYQQPTM